MVIGLIGENCSGKSTLAARIMDAIRAEVVTGKDYLRMAKSEVEARCLFRKKLAGAVRILVSADLDTIKARFRARMRGVLPAPVERMLESKHGMFDHCAYDYRYDSIHGDATALCEQLGRIESNGGLLEWRTFSLSSVGSD